jgi:hypothetical protein
LVVPRDFRPQGDRLSLHDHAGRKQVALVKCLAVGRNGINLGLPVGGPYVSAAARSAPCKMDVNHVAPLSSPLALDAHQPPTNPKGKVVSLMLCERL